MMAAFLLLAASAADSAPASEASGSAMRRFIDCIGNRADQFHSRPGPIKKIANQVLKECREERSAALALGAVPKFASTVEAFDSDTRGYAIGLIGDARHYRQ